MKEGSRDTLPSGNIRADYKLFDQSLEFLDNQSTQVRFIVRRNLREATPFNRAFLHEKGSLQGQPLYDTSRMTDTVCVEKIASSWQMCDKSNVR